MKSKASTGPMKSKRKRPIKPPKKQRLEHKRRCKAKNRSGNQCKNYAIKGALVCRNHGGSAPQVKEAAKKREAKAAALREAGRLIERDGVDADPIDHLLDSLAIASQLVRVFGSMCVEIDEAQEERLMDDKTRGELGYSRSENPKFALDVESREKLLALNRHGEAQLHPFLVLYLEALDRRAKFAKMAIDAGVAQAQVELMEQQVEAALAALEATLDQLGIKGKDRQEAKQTYAGHLRAVA